MPDDRARAASPEISQADNLYRGFPDFSAWGELSPSDIDLWDRFAVSLEERRKAATPEALKAAVDVAVRAAALDTGAIEGLYSVDRGFTMTVAVQALAWEQMVEERGAGVRELFEAQLEAYELVLNAVTGHHPITEAWIRTLHATLCAPQKTYRVLTDVGWQEQDLPKGQYKTRPNHVRLTDGTFHAYAPVDRVSSEMHRLLEQIRTPEFEAAHPVLQASYVHYAFVVIHPFADGNGRVARALASTFFYRSLSIPLVIFSNQRIAYLDALHATDLGDRRPVMLFFRDRGIDTMQLVAESLLTAETAAPQVALSKISNGSFPRKEFSSTEMEDIALRLLQELQEQFESQLESLQRPRGFQFMAQGHPDNQPVTPSYRRLARVNGALRVLVILPPNFSSRYAQVIVRALPRAEPSHLFAFLIEAHDNDDRLEIRLDDVYPELSTSFQIRLEGWIRRQLSKLLQKLAEQAGQTENWEPSP